MRLAPAPHMSKSTNPTQLSPAFRAVWRWHFYAGLLVLPVLCLMALTGALYLFKPEIEDLAYRSMLSVGPGTTEVSADRWVRAAEVGLGGRATAVVVPDRPDRAVLVRVTTPAGPRTAFVDPHDAHLTGAIDGEGVMDTVKRLHSLELFGRPFNILVEIVAGWAIILVATGIFLWWPRRRAVGVVTLSSTDAGRRPFWRDLHALTGLYAGLVVAFLAVTGMPWSAVWGDRVLALMRESGLGRPPAPAAANPWSHAGHHDRPHDVGWTMEGVVLHAPGQGGPRVDSVIAAAERQGMARPYTVSIPQDPSLAFTVSRETRQAEQARTLYVDARTGQVMADARWTQFGAGAKAFEWGIAVHQGLQYGWANRLIMLGGCIGIWVLSISGVLMWWKRRPKGGLGAPPVPPGPRARAMVLGIVLPLAILYPLTGLSLLAALLLDRLVGLARRQAADPAS